MYVPNRGYCAHELVYVKTTAGCDRSTIGSPLVSLLLVRNIFDETCDKFEYSLLEVAQVPVWIRIDG